MKLLTVGLLSLVAFTANSKELTSYAQIEDAALTGHSLHYVVDVPLCKEHPRRLSVLGVAKLDAFVVYESERITTATDHFTMAHPEHKGEPVLEHVKYDLDNKGIATIVVNVLNPRDYSVLSTTELKCQLNSGFYVYQNAED